LLNVKFKNISKNHRDKKNGTYTLAMKQQKIKRIEKVESGLLLMIAQLCESLCIRPNRTTRVKTYNCCWTGLWLATRRNRQTRRLSSLICTGWVLLAFTKLNFRVHLLIKIFFGSSEPVWARAKLVRPNKQIVVQIFLIPKYIKW